MVLIVDDEADIRITLAGQLAARYEVATAGDGLEAIQWLASHRSRVDAIILDLHLPRLNGFDVLDYLRWANLHVPVIACTSSVEMAAVLAHQTGPVTCALVKPVAHQQLLARLDAIVGIVA